MFIASDVKRKQSSDMCCKSVHDALTVPAGGRVVMREVLVSQRRKVAQVAVRVSEACRSVLAVSASVSSTRSVYWLRKVAGARELTVCVLPSSWHCSDEQGKGWCLLLVWTSDGHGWKSALQTAAECKANDSLLSLMQRCGKQGRGSALSKSGLLSTRQSMQFAVFKFQF